MDFPEDLQARLLERQENLTCRKLGTQNNLIDFSSNDYLGFAKSAIIFDKTHQFLVENNYKVNGATGSRLLCGNHFLYTEVEKQLCEFHHSESALVFNSGYSANVGFFSCVPQRNDLVLYDQYCHASIRDGIKLSKAKAYKFFHNDFIILEKKLQQYSKLNQNIYVITESVFSMDGDSPDLVVMGHLCKKYGAYLIVDEAHSVGIFGKNGSGLIQELDLEKAVFARIITFGKALGTHGAAVVGTKKLKDYLVNFARSFIYTTGLPPHCLATIKIAYQQLLLSFKEEENPQEKLQNNIQFFKSELQKKALKPFFIDSSSAVHCCGVSGNKNVKHIAKKLQQQGFSVKPILSPTVPKTKERLRFCLHSYNSKAEITTVLTLLADFINEL